MVTTRPPKTIVKPTALGLVANTDTKLLIYGLFKKGRVLAQDGITSSWAPRRCDVKEAAMRVIHERCAGLSSLRRRVIRFVNWSLSR